MGGCDSSPCLSQTIVSETKSVSISILDRYTVHVVVCLQYHDEVARGTVD